VIRQVAVVVSVVVLGALGAGCGSSIEEKARELRTATSQTTTAARGTPARTTRTTRNRTQRSESTVAPGKTTNAAKTSGRPKAKPPTPAPTRTTPPKAKTPPRAAPRIRLTAPTPTPAVGEPWPYTIRVTDRRGKPVQGTATVTVVTPSGQKIDGVGIFDAGKIIRMTYRWPKVDRGRALFFRVEAATPDGTKTLRYAIRVR